MTCRLLELPPELRNAIYVYAVLENGPVPLRMRLNNYCIEPALLATNRQIRSECLPVIYGQNTLESGYSHRTRKFLTALSADKLKMIRQLQAWDVEGLAHMTQDQRFSEQTRAAFVAGIKNDMDVWVRKHSRGNLREDALQVPLRTLRGTKWVTATQLPNWKIVGKDGEAVFVRKDEQKSKKKMFSWSRGRSGLPPELRAHIYTFVLISPSPFGLRPFYPHIRETALLAVNRQIYSEALPVFYGGNTFKLAFSNETTSFLKALIPGKAKLIKKLQAFAEDPLTARKVKETVWMRSHTWIEETMRFWVDDCTGGQLRGGKTLVPLWQKTGGSEWVPGMDIQQWRVKVEGKEAWFVRMDEHGGGKSDVS